MTPLRKCVFCGRRGTKDTFYRVVRLPDGTFRVDGSGRMNGRGAYVCRNEACARGAAGKNSFQRSFRQAVPKEIYERLEQQIGE